MSMLWLCHNSSRFQFQRTVAKRDFFLRSLVPFKTGFWFKKRIGISSPVVSARLRPSIYQGELSQIELFYYVELYKRAYRSEENFEEKRNEEKRSGYRVVIKWQLNSIIFYELQLGVTSVTGGDNLGT